MKGAGEIDSIKLKRTKIDSQKIKGCMADSVGGKIVKNIV